MKSRIVLLLVCACCGMASAQKEANIWYFGQSAGLDFNTNCQPTALFDNRLDGDYGNAVISDGRTGQLLFYTDNIQVRDRNHSIMPNGQFSALAGYAPLTQSSLIVPFPNNSFVYYLFRLNETNASNTGSALVATLRYALVDMRLNNGRGDVVTLGKDSLLSTGLSGRLTAVRHTNGRDYWLLTHQWNSNAFLVYPLTPTGIGPADTIYIGSTHRNQEVTGFLKASPNGRRLACSSTSTTARPFDLFDFDATSGKISNYINLGNVRWQYGVSFSPDNTKLYVSNQTVLNTDLDTELIRQYDLSAGDTPTIIASGKSILYQNQNTNAPQAVKNARNGLYAPSLQIGPDGHIYAAADYSNDVNGRPCVNCAHHFLIINNPNAPGFTCDPQLQVAELGNGSVGDSNDFPNFMQHYFNGLEPRNCAFDRNDECTDANVQIFPNPAKDVLEILISDICFTPYILRIVNTAGQILASYEVTTPLSQRMDVSQLSGGVYFAELRFADRTTIKRFVKF